MRERGHFLTWEDYWRHSRSLGADETHARQRHTETEDICLVVGGKRYFVGAAHFQFTGPKAAFQSILPLEYDRPMGQVRRLDIALNDKGYLRLSTPEWWVQHMGNTLAGNHSVALPKAYRRLGNGTYCYMVETEFGSRQKPVRVLK